MDPSTDPDWEFRVPSPRGDAHTRTRRGAGLEPPVLLLPSPAQYRPFLLEPPMNSESEAVSDMEQSASDVNTAPATPPVPSPVSSLLFVLTDNEVSVFSDLAPFLRNKQTEDTSRPVYIDLTCRICLDSKLEMPAQFSQPSATGNTEPFTVIPCGHIFGHNCLLKYVNDKIWNNGAPTCPICRFSFRYSEWRHQIPIRSYDAWLKRRGQLPLTAAEGGRAHPSCFSCSRDAFESELDIIEDMIYPVEAANSYIDPMNNGLVVVSRLRQEMRRSLLRQFHANWWRSIQW